MAYTVGTCLIILVFIGVPLRYGFNFPYIAEDVGALHGILYVVYLIICLELLFHYRLKWYQLILMAAAGLVPFLSFVMERKMTKYLESRNQHARRPRAEHADVGTPS
jgi:integral membrane protein